MGDRTKKADFPQESENMPDSGTPAAREVVPQGDCAKEVFQRINELRKISGSYCDLIIKVGGKLFSAHKIIMAGFSSYFEMRIPSGSGGEGMLEISGIKAEIFEIILEYAYFGSIVITEDNAEDLLRSACYLKASRLKNICEKFLGRNTNIGNVWRFSGIASDLSCSALAEYVNEFVVKNFSDVCQTDMFLEMKPDLLIDSIKRDDLNVRSEEDVLNAVLKWTNHDKDREPLITKLLVYVRLACVDPGYLWKCINEESAIRTSPDCTVLFSKALMHKLKPDCLDEKSSLFITPREHLANEVLIISGRQSPSSKGLAASDWFYSLNLGARKVTQLKPLPDKYVRTAVAVNADTMYVCCDAPVNMQTQTLERVYMRYEFQSDTWEKVTTNLPSGCDLIEGAELIELSGFFYVKASSFFCNRLACRQLTADSGGWSWTLEMPGTNSMSVCFRVDETIYAIGCSNVPNFREPTFARHDPITRQWTKLASLLQSEEKYLYCPFEGRIYVFGGAKNEDASVMRPQVYNIAANKWEWGPALSRVSKHPAALAVLNNRLTFIDMDKFPCLHIERLSSHDDTWRSCEVKVDCKLPVPKDDLHFCAGTVKMKQS